MRDKINSDPKYQVGLIVILLLVAGFMLMNMGGGEESEEAASTEATVAVAGTEATGTAVGATPGEAVEGAVEGAIEAAASEASAASVAASIPAPPLPHPVAEAYDSGKTVVLLVVHDGGIDDRLVKRSVPRLNALGDVAVFVVPVSQIARYAAVTLAVEVQRVPALITVRPRSLSDGNPQASVIYGYQSPQSMEQAVRDARYDGPSATYYPG
ncbi:MAG TPA: hypothetical protein VIH47_04370 [Solirubrobacterales bacterium]